MFRSICVLVGIFGVASSLPAADKRCELKLLAALDVEVDQDGTVLVPVTIEGHDVWMILSLERGLPMLYSTAVKELQLRTSQANTGATMGGKPMNTIVKVKQLLVGRVNYTSEMLVSPDDPGVSKVIHGKLLAGLLTSRLIQVVDMELNLAENKVNLFSQTNCKGAAVYWGGEFTAVHLYTDPAGLLVFPMEIDDHVIETSFNTSSRYSSINTNVTRKYFGFDQSSPDIQREGAGGKEISSYRAMALTAKGLQVRNSKIRLTDNKSCRPASSGRVTHAIGCDDVFNFAPFSIGTDLLKSLRVYIATREDTVYFTRVDPVAPVIGGAAMPAPAPAAPAQ
jgi:hypothetical protein